MTFNSNDTKGFVLGVLASITAVVLWDLYKKKRGILEFGEKKLIEEVKLAINGIKSEPKKSVELNS